MIAAHIDSYRRGLREALQASAADGYRLLHAGTVETELDPARFSHSARRHLSKYLADLGLRLAGLSAEFPGLGLGDPQTADARLAHVRATLEMCAEMRLPVAVVSLRGLGDATGGSVASQVASQLADLADRAGVRVALATGDDDPTRVLESVRTLGCPNLGLAIDSAARGIAPAAACAGGVEIASVTLRDVHRSGGGVEETRFGGGDVDFAALLAELAAGDYRGELVIHRRQPGVDGMRQAREYIDSLATAARRG
ncbi:Xylose isomerase-like TIM barrel [Phycisphaerae bacterium RAS1]|nr:Xylose isomerase-like TIM barrel [Phycisphaerae bacterium RAS1]